MASGSATVGQNVTPTPAPRPTPTAAPSPAPAAGAPTTGATADKATISSPAAPQNPYASIGAPGSAEVKVDGWKKGKNDCLEHILTNQGYSLEEIYKKDSEGKTLLDRVAAQNDMKDPNMVRTGQKLTVPSKLKENGGNAEAVSTKDLKAGETATASVGDDRAGIDLTAKKAENGTQTVNAETRNDNRDAGVSTESTVGEKGRIDAVASSEGDTSRAQVVAKNSDGSAMTRTDVTAKPDNSEVSVTDIDRKANLGVTVTDDQVQVNNPGAKKGDDVGTTVDISEKSSDGFFENAGRGIYEFFGGSKPEEKPATEVANARQVQVTKNGEGQATVTTTGADGKKTTRTTAGDTDDSWVERAGEGIDDATTWVGRQWNRLFGS
ncbi:hypothetical protein DYH09_18930 [bacterium CPR1]|nr:hypothetical protein [bacterium CPR1]